MSVILLLETCAPWPRIRAPARWDQRSRLFVWKWLYNLTIKMLLDFSTSTNILAIFFLFWNSIWLCTTKEIQQILIILPQRWRLRWLSIFELKQRRNIQWFIVSVGVSNLGLSLWTDIRFYGLKQTIRANPIDKKWTTIWGADQFLLYWTNSTWILSASHTHTSLNNTTNNTLGFVFITSE